MRSKSGPGDYLYHYGLCELAQRQAVLIRKDKLSDRAIKSDRAKVVVSINEKLNIYKICEKWAYSACKADMPLFLCMQFLICHVAYFPKGVNIILYVKGFFNHYVL